MPASHLPTAVVSMILSALLSCQVLVIGADGRMAHGNGSVDVDSNLLVASVGAPGTVVAMVHYGAGAYLSPRNLQMLRQLGASQVSARVGRGGAGHLGCVSMAQSVMSRQ